MNETAVPPWLDEPVSADAVDRALAGLDDDQRRAVVHGEGPLLVVAGAGTGKTKVIAHRIAYLIAAKRAHPAEILALTFTERAAAEMESRVDLLVPYGYTEMAISTFHAFGDRLFREHGLELGLSDQATVLNEAERVVFFRERLFRLPLRYFLPLGNPVRHLRALLQVAARAKDEGVLPEDYLDFTRRALSAAEAAAAANPAGNQEDSEAAAALSRARRQLEVAQVYRVMDEELHRAGRIDFGDQILLALRLLCECPHVLAALRRRFRYILVDEFQDTNVAQFEMLKLLAGGHRNITVVGDDDQSIYKFRGAAIGNILSFSGVFPDRSLVVLTGSYRSGQSILDAAYRLIQYNNPERLETKEGIQKRLRSLVDGPGAVEHHRYDTLHAEADAVAARIQALNQSGRALREIAVLVRANRDAAPFLAALTAAGIPHEFSGQHALFAREEVRLCIAFLRAVTRRTDSQSLFALAASDVYQLPMDDLVKLADLARSRNRTFHWALAQAAGEESGGTEGSSDRGDLQGFEPLSDEGLTIARQLRQDLATYLDAARRRTTGELLYQFLTDTGYLAELIAAETLQGEEKVQNIARFFDLITRMSEIALADRAHAFVDHLDLLIEAGDEPQAVEPDPHLEAVRVLTVHRAKGLEFPVVFVVNLVSQKFPTNRRHDPIELPPELYREPVAPGDFHRAEERRLFYVAMTRARDLLVLTSAADHGGVTLRKTSPFVLEALDLPAAQASAAVPRDALGAIERHAGSRPAPAGLAVLGVAPRLPAPDEILVLSHSRLDAYETCPLRYKFAYILRAPAIPHHSQNYGIAMHIAIAHLLTGRIHGAPPPMEEVVAAFRAAWRSEGYLSREHEERRFEAGLKVLERFYIEELASPRVPAQVEKEFGFPLGKSRIEGRMDRVDLDPHGASVIDYKTSAVADAAEAAKRTRESTQLRIYALAYRHQAGVLPRRVELRYVESGLIGSIELTEDDLAETGKTIERIAAGIRAGNYDAQPSPRACGRCPFNRICPHAMS